MNRERGLVSEVSRPLGVVIPTLDRPRALLRCLQSVLGGSVVPDVCVVVDQSEGDETRQALGSMIEDGRIRYLRSGGRGISRGLNEGIEAASAEVVGITGDDCTVDVRWLEGIRAAFEGVPDLEILFGAILPASHDAARGFIPSYRPSTSVTARTIGQKDRIGGTSACMALRAAAWRTLGGFDQELGIGAPLGSAEDADLTLRALGRGMVVCEDPSVWVVHHGFFRWEQRGDLIRRNWYGTGAAFAKSLRLHRAGSARALVNMALRWVRRGSRVAAGLGHGSHRRQTARAFLSGFREGLRAGIDGQTGHFLAAEGRPSEPSLSASPTPCE